LARGPAKLIGYLKPERRGNEIEAQETRGRTL